MKGCRKGLFSGTGDAAMISGYLGNRRVFDEAVAKFAAAYADQTENDHVRCARRCATAAWRRSPCSGNADRSLRMILKIALECP